MSIILFNNTFPSVLLQKRSISDVIVSTQHRTETTNLSSMLHPTIPPIQSNNSNQNQSKKKSSKSVGFSNILLCCNLPVGSKKYNDLFI